ERHRKVIDALVPCGKVVRITEEILESRANPAFLFHMVGCERRDPFLSVAGVIIILIGAGGNLWPLIVVLHILCSCDVKIAQIHGALYPLRACAYPTNRWEPD